MSKAVKKKSKRLWRTVRKTLGTLFLVSALVIAAIPVDNLQAIGDVNSRLDQGIQDVPTSTVIPRILPGDPVYTYVVSYEGGIEKAFNFVYVPPDNQRPNGMATNVIITGYQREGQAPAALSIPEEVDGYRQYTDTTTTGAGLAAAGKNGNFLFYRNIVQEDYTREAADRLTYGQAPYYYKAESTFTDENGQEMVRVTREDGDFKVCFKTDISTWLPIEDGEYKLYYYKDGTTVPSSREEYGADRYQDFHKVSPGSSYERIKGIKVNYISDQYQKADGTWETITSPEQGVFHNVDNITELRFGASFGGVGNYAFYGCTGLRSIEFHGGLQVVGESAFEACTNLGSAVMDQCLLGSISSKAFKDCTQLASFNVPISVTQIGNSAFEGCTRLTKVDLCGDEEAQGQTTANLRMIGKDVFKGCSGLTSVTFPELYTEDVYISAFMGCRALKNIGVRNTDLTFKSDGSYYTLADFRSELGGDDARFYFSGPVIEASDPNVSEDDRYTSALLKTCKDECLAFGYTGGTENNFADQNRYEITRRNGAGTETFEANAAGELTKYRNSGQPQWELTIPSNIGTYEINTLKKGVFQDRCNLRTVTIPASVTKIEEDAFKGCHNLEWVTFPADDGVEIIGTAFATQSANHDSSSCIWKPSASSDPDSKLHFVGTISPDTGSFAYAMSANGMYSAGGQNDSYITYCSAPEGVDPDVKYKNLEVEYNPELGMSELVKFPSLEELYDGTYSSSTYEYLDADYVSNATDAIRAYMDTDLTQNTVPSTAQQNYIDSALKIEIPNGVQSIKQGLLKEKDKANFEFLSANASQYLSKNSLEMTVEAYNLAAIKEGTEDETAYGGIQDGTGTFAGCTHLTGVKLIETATAPVIEAHAFQNCENLETIDIPKNVTDMGRCPFYNCGKLREINFQNNENFAFEDAIIYRLGAPGEDGQRPKIAIFECLKNRYKPNDKTGELELEDPFRVIVPQSELMKISGDNGVDPEAFRGSNVREVDLRNTTITTLQEGTFADTDLLQLVKLPSTLKNIVNYAFANSGIDTFEVWGTETEAEPYAFYGGDADAPYKTVGMKRSPGNVNWFCLLDEATPTYKTGKHAKFILGELPVPVEYTVNFEYYNQNGEYVYLNDVQKVTDERDVVYPEDVADRITEDNLPKKLDENQPWTKKENAETKTWTYTAKYNTIMWTVTLMDSPDRDSKRIGEPFQVVEGYSAEKMADELLEANVPKEVYDRFDKWSCAGDYTSVTQDLTMVATYVPEGMHIVKYYAMVGSYNNYELYTRQTVKEGEDAPDIKLEGEEYQIPDYSFVGWKDLPTKVDKPWDVYARYMPSTETESPSPSPDPDESPSPSPSPDPDKNPSPSPNPDASPSPSPGTSPSPNPSPSPSPSPNPGGNTGSGNEVARHTLQVRGGSGSGYYTAGEQIIITADEPARGQQFTSWTVSPASTVVTDKTLASFILTMPDHDVAVIANYKASPSSGGSSSSTGTGNSSSTNSRRPNSSTGTVGGTTVIIDKNGLSNTGVVSATVNGSSDDFTLKITESSSAAESVLRALQAEYGSLDNIRYFPMDISLYDSTGNNKITDTTGLSVSITLPLPDSLIAYAGNNKVAGVVNDRLDKLTPKFTTINGVACMTFTAEHFSPYVIYVDIVNLSDGTISDSTPTTGDGIHPKWFLSIGLACLSFVMFMIKDNKSSSKKKKVAVKARS